MTAAKPQNLLFLNMGCRPIIPSPPWINFMGPSKKTFSCFIASKSIFLFKLSAFILYPIVDSFPFRGKVLYMV